MPSLLEVLRDALAPRYEVERELGAGGMATVFLAVDTKHDRKVAVKVLRSELATELGHERFLREIGIAARLQHPHILTLIDSGEADGLLYYVMPHVEGESLRSRLSRERRLPMNGTLRILRDVADALAHAHGYGVVHRDVKPGNVMLSGRHALVLDFGVAKAVSSAGHDTLTTQGVSLGTPVYMSPEQAVGDPGIDHRADIYALGVVGYELVAGEPPFSGDTPQAILSAHVLTPPRPLGELRPEVPGGLEELLMRCLEKEPEARWQSAGDVLERLEGLTTPSGGTQPVRALASRALSSAARFPLLRKRALLVAALGLAAIAAGVALWRGLPGGGPAVAASYKQLTFSGRVFRAEISPDGELLAYMEEGESTRLLVRDLRGERVIEIARTGLPLTLRWSPDGSSLLFTGRDSAGQSSARLYPRLGGTPRSPPIGIGHTAWSPDASQVAQWPTPGPIRLTTLATGDTSWLSLPDSVMWLRNGDWSPDSRFLALAATDSAGKHRMILAGAVDGSGWRRLVIDTVHLSSPRWSPRADAVYYIRGGFQGDTPGDELRKIRLTPEGGRRGAPEVLQVGLGADIRTGFVQGGLSLSADGRKLVYVKREPRSNLWSVVLDKHEAGARLTTLQLTGGTARKSVPRPSPDGEWIAYSEYRQDEGDVFVIPARGGSPRRVTSSSDVVSPPAWSPDGQTLAYIVYRQGVGKVRTIPVLGGRVRTYEATHPAIGYYGYLAWAPGERILYRRTGNRNFHFLDPASEAEEPLVADPTVGWTFSARYSPTADHVALYWNRSLEGVYTPGIYAVAVRNSSESLLLPPDSARSFRRPIGWSADGSSVYVIEYDSGNILRVPVTAGEAGVVTTLPFQIRRSSRADFHCTATEREAGLTLLCTVPESVSDAWMIENFDPDVG